MARNVYCDSPGCGLKAAKRAAQKRYLLRERHAPSRDKRPKTRLTDKQVKIIRNKCNRYSGGQYPAGFIKGLAENYGVSKSLIYKIAEGEARTKVK
jgi:DNA invertase Pin-like site-specific DNA recombinase